MGSVQNRVLAIFINTFPRALGPRDIANITGMNYNSVKSAIRRLTQLGFLKKIDRGLYVLVDRDRAVAFLSAKTSECKKFEDKVRKVQGKVPPKGPAPFLLSPGLRQFIEQFIDVESAVVEDINVPFRVKRTVAEKLRRGHPVKENDKARQVVIRHGSVTMVVSEYGSVRLFFSDPNTFLRDLIEILKKQGLTEEEMGHFFMQLSRNLHKSNMSIEVPILDRELAKMRGSYIESRCGPLPPLITKVVGSHWHAELEIRGPAIAAMNFFHMLAAVQHFSMPEFLQCLYARKQYVLIKRMERNISKLVRWIQKGIEAEREELRQQQVQQDRREDLSYVS